MRLPRTVPRMGSPSPGDARWCPAHGRLECTGQRSRGRGQCHGPAVRGTDRCRAHLGKSVAQARRDVLTEWAAVPGDDGISPRMAVAAQLGLAWRRAQLLGELLRQQAEADSGDSTPGGLVGHTYSADRSAGGVYPTGERARALVELERAERELVVRFAEAGHRMGIEEAKVRVLAEHVEALTMVLTRVLERFGLDDRRPQVRLAVWEELRAIGRAGDGDAGT
jgi:hypothetical protein